MIGEVLLSIYFLGYILTVIMSVWKPVRYNKDSSFSVRLSDGMLLGLGSWFSLIAYIADKDVESGRTHWEDE